MSTTDQPAPKRKRTGHGDAEPQPTINTIRSEVWFEDGNIVLQAGGTQFKVYRGILSQSSSVFKDMFSLPQPPEKDEDLIEGCPIVHLSDSVKEVEHMLEALYQRKYIFVGEPLSLSILDAFIAMGKKYDIEILRTEALKRLYHEFPTTLEGQDSVVPWTMVEQPSSFIEIVSLARRNGLLSILPHSLYACCNSNDAASMGSGMTENGDGCNSVLSLEDRLACLIGYQTVGIAQATTTFSWAHANAIRYPHCTKFTACAAARMRFLIHRFYPVPSIRGLSPWRDDIVEGMCQYCIAVAKVAHTEGRRKLWEQLPGLFGLPVWDELIKERHGL